MFNDVVVVLFFKVSESQSQRGDLGERELD